MGALSHLRVLDLSRVLAGPWASQILADLGAEVIKIERPDTGDDTRAWGPPWVCSPEWKNERQSAYFVGANRNKKSVAIDIANAQGQKIVRQLACQCDIIIENFKVDGLRQYGLDYESLKQNNPKIIYCSITGFGQTGPYARRPGYDFIVQGMGGLMSITGRPDGEAGEGPLKVGVALTDILTGLYATVGIFAAPAHRDKTGEGQHIDASLLDVQIACLANQAMNFLATGEQPPRLGNSHPNIVPYQDFPTKNGYIIVTVGNDAQFSRLCEAIGRPEIAVDSRFSTNSARVANRGVLIPFIKELMLTRTTSEWLEIFDACSVPCGPINDLAAVFNDPHVKYRGIKVDLSSDRNTPISIVASPIRLSASPVEYHSAPPRLGGNTLEVLDRMLSLDQTLVDELIRNGVIRP